MGEVAGIGEVDALVEAVLAALREMTRSVLMARILSASSRSACLYAPLAAKTWVR